MSASMNVPSPFDVADTTQEATLPGGRDNGLGQTNGGSMQRIFSSGRYASVTATLALVVALGGTSYAAISLPANSVGNVQIKPHAVKSSDLGSSAVTSAKVKNGSLRAVDFAAGQLPAPPTPPSGALYAHVDGTGALDNPRTSAGITMTSTHYAQGNWPVYCFSISGAPPKNIVATPENTTRPMGSFIGFETIALNASVDAPQLTTWGCGSGTDAAVISMQTPESALYVAFQR